MTSIQVVAEKAAKVATLAAGFIAEAAAGLVSKAGSLSLEELSRRLDGAFQALQGKDVPTSGAAAIQKAPLQLAQEMVNSYAFDKTTGVSTFIVPGGVTDRAAMEAINVYFRENFPDFNRDAVYADDLAWVENLPTGFPTHCEQRDYSQARQITITGVVQGTLDQNRATQESVLRDDSLAFADPRSQALAGALHACTHAGEDLFKGLWVRGSVPGFALSTYQNLGVSVDGYDVDGGNYDVAASGSPSPELK